MTNLEVAALGPAGHHAPKINRTPLAKPSRPFSTDTPSDRAPTDLGCRAADQLQKLPWRHGANVDEPFGLLAYRQRGLEDLRDFHRKGRRAEGQKGRRAEGQKGRRRERRTHFWFWRTKTKNISSEEQKSGQAFQRTAPVRLAGGSANPKWFRLFSPFRSSALPVKKSRAFEIWPGAATTVSAIWAAFRQPFVINP